MLVMKTKGYLRVEDYSAEEDSLEDNSAEAGVVEG